MRVRQRRPSRWPLLVLVMALVGILFFLLEAKVKPTFMTIAEKQAEILAVRALNQAVDDQVVSTLDYTDLIRIERTEEGYVSHMVPNLMEVNRLITSITLVVQEELSTMERNAFGIPLGEILGSRLFAAYGPRLSVAMIPLGVVNVKPVEYFEESGINQVRHSIYVEATIEMQVVIPLSRRETTIVSEFPVAEAIIVGPVPQQYLQFNLGR